MADKVVWFELPADDVARAGKFYHQVFGWDASDMGNGSLAVVSGDVDEQLTPTEVGSINGDISPRSEGFDHPLVVIAVDDIETRVKTLEQAGGSMVLTPKKIEEMGMIWAIAQDTEGNRIGIIQNL